MIAAMLAAAAVHATQPNTLKAPPGFYARAQWDDARHVGVAVLVENQLGVSRKAVAVWCKFYNRDGVIVDASMAYPGELPAHEAVKTWGVVDQTHERAERFACRVTEGFDQ